MDNIVLDLIFSLLASMGFCVIFNIKGKNFLYASLGGMIAWGSFVSLKPLIADEIARYFLASVVISIYSQIMAKTAKSPVSVFLVVSFIPLVPGYSIYKTMENLLLSNMDEFIIDGIATFKICMAISMGCLITSNLLTKLKKPNSN